MIELTDDQTRRLMYSLSAFNGNAALSPAAAASFRQRRRDYEYEYEYEYEQV
ncbi:hypothetical protein [Dickeya dianthicola]|uniref:hypothetical protein n=1 Tax=Dickeya dianthicola TaxID=204039 RepID=UPI0003D79515|nr:hypothetical protein [Dickeya dianthicola]MCI4116679.1 hypothetical protein [Dickeya dianthicola]MCI4119827.1 hypothetical protein [Dickeya dianthicola]MCI4122698.1 hypothetical protein [Dickeya dianthicola]MCI4191414.1 hypothetical protein [Dickeya dianthicola]MCI4198584.1 hypothetical protein [Dickeya dianthicola]